MMSIHGSLLVISGMFWAVARDVTANTASQETGLQENVVAAVSAAAAVVAPTATAYLGENVGDECDEQPKAKIGAPR